MQTNLLYKDTTHKLYAGNNLDHLPTIKDKSVHLVCIDPPYNTGIQRKFRSGSYNDNFENSETYIAFMKPIIEECFRVLTDNGSLFLIIDHHEEYNIWTLLRSIFGKNNLINKIIWAYDWGHREKKRWTPKHDTLFWFVKDTENYIFERDACDRISKRSPNLFEDGSIDKLPTDVWWQTIVTASANESTGYPTQKPLKLIERIIMVHTNPGNIVMDCFAGSGTVGIVAAKHNCSSILMDKNPESWKIIKSRMEDYRLEVIYK